MNIQTLKAFTCFLALTALASPASASYVNLVGPGSVTPGSSFSIDMRGNFDPDGLFGADANVLWDDAILNLTNITATTTLDTFAACAGPFAGSGLCAVGPGSVQLKLSNIFAPAYIPAGAGEVSMLTLQFTAVGAGVSNISIANDVWAGLTPPSPNPLFPTVTNTSVGVVPVPAAVWLFGSGLLGLVGVARRRKAA